ncbi:MAG: PSD1 and planctomycete cytochrome C domain-containing protein [Pirellulaceae bacterium]|nr:PSD1 and planctomycete cytochrome C domain-containing protein [Pirellulaceae bacterium]
MRRLYFLLLFVASSTLAAEEKNREGLDFFEAKIRPMLVKHCYECHSVGAAAKKNLKGGLFLDSRDGSRQGGESGPAVVPGKPGESLLINALKQDAFKMPPKGKLPDEVIAHFEKWITLGAPDPRDGVAVATSSEIDIEEGKKHWSFQPLSEPAPPTIKDSKWARNEIDQFIRARQEAAGITPNANASARTLIRRAYFDLVGLPPAPTDVDKFVADFAQDADAAYSRLIDDLLASRHYGERWARHWMDIVRYAESNGYAFDGDRPFAWHYRDFIIRALNSDMPYDEFVRLQIAGDLLTNTDVQTADESKTAIDHIAATGFVVAGPYTTQQTQKERERSRYEQLDDMIGTIGTSLLGLTVGCARCHSHKFDPLPQFDYYRMASAFADVGFSNTGIKSQPEAYRDAKTKYDSAHGPLVAARSKHEQEQLPGRVEKWLELRTTTLGVCAPLKIESWHHVGPFVSDNLKGGFDTPYGPEEKVDLAATFEEGKLKWTEQPEWKDDTVHNVFSGDNTANYIYRIINSPVVQDPTLFLGSDDAIKVWVNGTKVHENFVSRGAAVGQEAIKVSLKEGRNEVLIKIVNGGGPSGFAFGVKPLESRPVTGWSPWHHIGPFQAANHDLAFDEFRAPEEEIKLEATYEDGKLKWTEQPEWKDGVAHNDKLTGNNVANYLFRTIEVDRPQPVALSLGSDDGLKLWVNGRMVVDKKVTRNEAAADQEKATIQLAAGRNEILMKITNADGKSGFYFAANTAPTPAEIVTIAEIPAEKRNDDQKKNLAEWYQGYDHDWLALNQAVVGHELKHPKPQMTEVFAARVRGSSYQFGADTYKVYQLRRGNPNNKEDEATPGFFRVLMRADQEEKHWLSDPNDEGKTVAGRIGLANWLSDVDQGAGHLLARVMVNRLWYHHFGRGIVATPSDFGTRGELPSHPGLLDWLASQLVGNGWQLKPIHKLIMTSATYKQADEITGSGQEHDPENFLLWRRNPRRLEAEVIRDSLLSVSGTLDDTMFGKGTLDQNSTRRSIYFTVKRGQLIPLLTLFDAPDAMQGIATREQSTVAPQALAMLNSPIIRDFATKFSAKVRANTETSIADAIDSAYQIALSRPATDDEKESMTAFMERQKMLRGEDPNAETLAVRDFCHLVLCLNEFVYIE